MSPVRDVFNGQQRCKTESPRETTPSIEKVLVVSGLYILHPSESFGSMVSTFPESLGIDSFPSGPPEYTGLVSTSRRIPSYVLPPESTSRTVNLEEPSRRSWESPTWTPPPWREGGKLG